MRGQDQQLQTTLFRWLTCLCAELSRSLTEASAGPVKSVLLAKAASGSCNCESQINWVSSVKGLARSVESETVNLRVVGKVSAFNRKFSSDVLKRKLLVLR
jgi:hypothetical protein